jgi:predicted dehydrogenase
MAAGAGLSANSTIGVGLVGSGGRGRLLTNYFKEAPQVEMRAVCDVYEPNLAKGLEAAGGRAKSYHDYRDMLASNDIDAVVVATPDHWHAQMTIDAVQAGKDVYVEKPMCHKIDEGFRVIEATRRTKRIVQVGTQRRSYDLFLEGKKVMDSGQLGEVKLVNAWWYNYQASGRRGKLEGKLDWERWLGPAPKRPPDPGRFLNWYYFWDYSGGLMVGQAAHVVDAIHWYMGSMAPLAVTCAGGKPHLEGVEVPETTVMTMEYPEDYLAVFTVGYRAMRYNLANDQLKQFHGSKARFDVGRESWAVYPESKEIEMKPSLERKQYGTFERAARQHVANFLDCVRTRREPNAPVEAGQATNIVLCLAMDALRTGRRLKWNVERRAVED